MWEVLYICQYMEEKGRESYSDMGRTVQSLILGRNGPEMDEIWVLQKQVRSDKKSVEMGADAYTSNLPRRYAV